MRGGLALLFLVSGVAALTVETVWMRWLRLLLGATAPAVSATLAAFFTGHALGAAWGARRVARWRSPLRAYGTIEVAAALAALAVPPALALGQAGLAQIYDSVRASPPLLLALRYGVALAASLPAAFCFGASLPAMGEAFVADPGALGPRGATLYGLNTLGAVAGAAFAGFLGPARIGVPATYGVGAALSLAAGAGALALAGRAPSRVRVASRGPARARLRGGRPAPRLLLVAGLSGFGALGLQVLLVQAFAQVLDQSVTAFGAVVAVVLVAIAFGALAVGGLSRWRRFAAESALAWALAASALALAFAPAAIFDTTHGLAPLGASGSGLAAFAIAAATVARGAGFPLFAASLVFPLVFAAASVNDPRAAARRGPASRAGSALGWLSAANTVGAVAGALAAAHALLPTLGLWEAFAALGACYGASACLWPGGRAQRTSRAVVLAAGAALVLAVANPLALARVHLAPGERLVDLQNTSAGQVSVVARGPELRLRVDGHYTLGGTASRVQQERQGHLALVLRPGARKVLFVGTATGITAGAARAYLLERVVLVELVPGVVRAARRFFAGANRGIYDAPRSRVIVDDARNYLASTRDRFDLIVGDLFVPWRSGVASLYTREHFEAVRRHLTADGAFCQWLPLYQLDEAAFETVLATFLDVFPKAALFRGSFFASRPTVAVVGWKGNVASPASIAETTRRLARSRATGDRWVTDPLGPWALYVAPLAPAAPWLAARPRHTDPHPVFEALAARWRLAGGRASGPLMGLRWARWVARAREAARNHRDPLFPALGAAARRAAAGGAALELAAAYWLEGRTGAAAEALGRAAAALPPQLFARAAPDPTASEVWGASPR